VPLFEETLALEKTKLGPDHPLTLTTMANLAVAYRMTHMLDRAVPLVAESIRLRSAKSGPDHPETWLARAIQGLNYMELGRLEEAVPLLEGAYRQRQRHATLRTVAPYLLDAYLRTVQPEKAGALAREMLSEGRAAAPPGSPQLSALLGQAALGLVAARAWDEAEPVVRECLAIREKAEPDAWTTYQARSLLGAVLLGRGRYADAEPLLRAGYYGLKQRADRIPPQARPRLGEALDRLIAWAEATGRGDEANAWREERAKLTAPPVAAPEKP
jgi:tetratricopeptide (TPR) repeat protein